MLFGDICTTRAASAEEASVLPAFTAAETPPLLIAIRPEEIEVIVASEDAITVGFEDSVTVQTEEGITVGFEDRMTVAFEDGVKVLAELFGDRVTTRADIVEVTALAVPVIATVTGAEVLPLDIGAPTAIN